MSVLESELKRALLGALPARLPDLRLFNRVVGGLEVRGHAVKVGIKGMADLFGYRRGGQAVEVELKAASGKMSEDQERWAAWCKSWGIEHHCLKARKDETLEQTIDRWILELSTSP